MIKKVSKITSLPKSASYFSNKKQDAQKRESSVKGDFQKIFEEELKKLR